MFHSIALFGAGRIGQVHADKIYRHPRSKLAGVIDTDISAAKTLADRYQTQVLQEEEIWRNPNINAIIIASPTPTHLDLIEKAAQSKKAIFCEKPIALDMESVDRALEIVAREKVLFTVGFNRRFDPHFQKLKSELHGDAIGKAEVLLITSRDPAPPPVNYLKNSGGLFRDMAIHDFDMARWLLEEEFCEIYAQGSVHVDPQIASIGDIDTATISLRTAAGTLCLINNSRRASYGYDQRIEIHGARGMLQALNPLPTTVRVHNDSGGHAPPLQPFFLERYREAYSIELECFLLEIEKGAGALPSGEDGRQALLLANAAEQSLRQGKAITLG